MNRMLTGPEWIRRRRVLDRRRRAERVRAPQPIGPTRCDQYRDLLETWAAWWDGPGREQFTGYVLPPLKATGEALRCIACAGVGPDDGDERGRCAACGRSLL